MSYGTPVYAPSYGVPTYTTVAPVSAQASYVQPSYAPVRYSSAPQHGTVIVSQPVPARMLYAQPQPAYQPVATYPMTVATPSPTSFQGQGIVAGTGTLRRYAR